MGYVGAVVTYKLMFYQFPWKFKESSQKKEMLVSRYSINFWSQEKDESSKHLFYAKKYQEHILLLLYIATQ